MEARPRPLILLQPLASRQVPAVVEATAAVTAAAMAVVEVAVEATEVVRMEDRVVVQPGVLPQMWLQAQQYPQAQEALPHRVLLLSL